MRTIIFQPFLAFIILSALANSQNRSIVDVLNISFEPPSEALNAFLPASIRSAEAPILIRYNLLLAAGNHEVIAACDPKALSFFGTKDAIPKHFCSHERQVILQAYIFYRVCEVEFPFEARGLGDFLHDAGLTPLADTMDDSTINGWANVKAMRLIRYFMNDGWNSLGSETKMNFRQPFQDTSGYAPVNSPFSKPDELSFPLRWQPLTVPIDFRGKYGIQVHAVPHLGTKVVPLALSQNEVDERQAPPLYSTPNRRGGIGKPDMTLVQELINSVFRRSRRITRKKIANSWLWESQFMSLGSLVPKYTRMLNISRTLNSRMFLGDMIARHDAVLLAWKEKRRNDFVRPSTLIRKIMKGERVRAFNWADEGVGFINAEEWETVLPTHPHSEYPSAAALICTASLEQLEISLKKLVLAEGQKIPPVEFNVTREFLPLNPIDEPVRMRFASLRQARRSCGISRLDAGVHFEPSVRAGFRLGRGLGKIAFRHVTDLYDGKLPRNCFRCM